jgi:hypothetical protein
MVIPLSFMGIDESSRYGAHKNRRFRRYCVNNASRMKLYESFLPSELSPNANYEDTLHLTYAGVGRRSGRESFMIKRALEYTTSQLHVKNLYAETQLSCFQLKAKRYE